MMSVNPDRWKEMKQSTQNIRRIKIPKYAKIPDEITLPQGKHAQTCQPLNRNI